MSNPREPTLWIVAGLVCITLAAFWPALHCGFINYDDPDYITLNTHVQQGLTLDGVLWAFTTGHAGNWHPLTWLSLMLDWQVFNGNSLGFHLTNVLLHCCNAVLLFLVLRRMTGARWRAALVAGIFAMHPLRVESVAWAAERKDVLCYFFGLLTLLAYGRYLKRPSFPRYALIVVTFALCLLSKSVFVTLPCLMLLLDFWPLGRFRVGQSLPEIADTPPARRIWSLAIEKVPLLAMSAATSAMTFHMQLVGHSVEALDQLALATRLANAVIAYMRYIEKLFVPRALAVFYPYVTDWHALQVVGSVTALLSITAFTLWQIRGRPWLFVGWCWFLGLLVPVIGIIQSGLQSMADRWSYLPTVGLLIMLVWSVPRKWLCSVAGRAIAACVCVAVLLALGVATRMQLRHWENSVTLFEHAVAVTDRNWLAYGALGNGYLAERRYADAADAARKGIAAKPNFYEGYCNLGNALAAQGRYSQAIENYQLALQIRPDLSEAHYNIGSLLLTDPSKASAAAEAFRHALAIRPSYVDAHIGLARAFVRLGAPAKAIESLRAALATGPANADAWYRLGVILSGQQRHAEANDAYREAIRINPNSIDARNGLAWSLATVPGATSGDGKEALEVITTALKLPDAASDPNLIDTLAAAQARTEQFTLAVETAKRALELARQRRMDQLASELTSRLTRYEQRLPFTQAAR